MLIGGIGRTTGASWELEVDLFRETHWCRSGRSCPVLSYRAAYKTVGVSHTGMALPTKFPEVPTRLMDLQGQNGSTPTPHPLEPPNPAAVAGGGRRGVVPPYLS